MCDIFSSCTSLDAFPSLTVAAGDNTPAAAAGARWAYRIALFGQAPPPTAGAAGVVVEVPAGIAASRHVSYKTFIKLYNF